MRRSKRKTEEILPGWIAAAVWLSLAMPGMAAVDAAPGGRQEYADGRVVCEVVPADESVPQMVSAILPIAMHTALEQLGPPPEPARLTIRLQKPPGFLDRAKSLFRAEAHAVQQGDEILLHPGTDPLRLAFRLGHEFSHWLVYKQHPIRPPLWLDEGLANGIAADAAAACARTLKQTVERPVPPKMDRYLYSLEDLLALQDYPRKPDQVGAFYWQAEALVSALRQKLGPVEFRVYLSLLASPDAPAWDKPLRERWYFTEWDIAWFARQIRPDSRQQPDP